MKLRTAVILIASAALSACVANKKPPADSTVDKATVKLAEAANSVSHSLNELARIQAVATPAVREAAEVPQTLELTNRASVDWSGPIGPLVERIAHVSNYKVRVLGTEPAIPVLVSINAHDARLADILRDASFQAGHKAEIRVFAKVKTIELRYAKV